MNNFNLDAEVLKCARLSLSKLGITDDVLKKLTKSYDVAKHFVEYMFSLSAEKFNAAADKYGIGLKDNALKNYLISHVENDAKALSVINEVYEKVNGDRIAWDRGLSAGDVLLTLQEELCGEGKPLNKILLLFDEFGRYIEYTAANPAIAGEGALQQIFEAIQTSNGKIIFSGFIQSELKAYLSRIDKTSNITRYIDRYRTACENLFLSSNFETILANILKKNNPEFDKVVGGAVNKYENFHNKMRSALNRWDRSAIKKSVWINEEIYNSVILKGCYPLHPITVWLLSGSHQWMQQRSTLAFAAEMFEQVAKQNIEGTWLPYIYPIQIIDSNIFNEMLNSEEKGLVSSQYCMLYRDIMVKVGDKLSESDKKVLKAILIMNMGRMAFFDKNDAVTAIQYCSNMKEDEALHALRSLEEMHGVIVFDDHSKTYDLVAEASGYNEFTRVFTKHRIGVKATINELDDVIRNQLNIVAPIETSFGQSNNISSSEWCFMQRLLDAKDITEDYLSNTVKTITSNLTGENPRGVLIYAYCYNDVENEIARLSNLYKKLKLSEHPIIILILEDSEKEILSALSIKKTFTKFSLGDKERFKKHIDEYQRKQNNNISRKFTSCITARVKIGENGRVIYKERLNALCTNCFTNLYSKIVPFAFDGFDSKNKSQAKSSLTTICIDLFNRSLMNEQVYNSLIPKDKNRVSAVMSTDSTHSWKIFDKHCQLVEPRHVIVKEIMDEVVNSLEDGQRHNMLVLFNKYMLPPYGMNENSAILFVSYFIAYHGNKYLYTFGNEKLTAKHWSDSKGKSKNLEIRHINIQKNANVDVDLIGEHCKKILSNNITELCAKLEVELENLIAQEGETEKNSTLIAQSKLHLETGKGLLNTINEKKNKVQSIIDEANKNFNILKVVGAFEKIPNTTSVIEEGFTYIYSEEYKKSITKLQSDIKTLLDKCAVKAINNVTCKITELSSFKKSYTRAANVLRNNNFESLAAIIEKRVEVVESELFAKQYYETSLIECEKDVALSGTTTKYQEASDLISKLNRWTDFFENADKLPQTIKEPLILKLNEAVKQLENVKQNVIAEYNSAVSDIKVAATESELKHCDSKFMTLLQMQLPEIYIQEIVFIQESIKNALNIINSLPKEIDKLADMPESITRETNTYCYNAIKQCILDLKIDLEKSEVNWITTYIENAEKMHETMSADECTRWLESTKSIPTYCSSKTIFRFEKLKTLVEYRLHCERVEGVVSMYNRLSDEEKKEFIRKIL